MVRMKPDHPTYCCFYYIILYYIARFVIKHSYVKTKYVAVQVTKKHLSENSLFLSYLSFMYRSKQLYLHLKGLNTITALNY